MVASAMSVRAVIIAGSDDRSFLAVDCPWCKRRHLHGLSWPPHRVGDIITRRSECEQGDVYDLEIVSDERKRVQGESLR